MVISHKLSSLVGVHKIRHLPDSTEGPYSQSGEEAASVQQTRGAIMRSTVHITPQDDPATSRKHSVLAGKDFSQNSCGNGADDASQLQDRSEPSSSARRCYDHGKVCGESCHNKRLPEDPLLVSIFESPKPDLLVSRCQFLNPVKRPILKRQKRL